MHYPATGQIPQKSKRPAPLGKRLILVAFLGIYLSYIVFFDLRIMTARLGIPTPELGLLLLVWGAALAPFILYFMVFLKVTKRNYLFLFLYFLYAAIGVLLGLYMQNPVSDLLGDFLKCLFIPAGAGIYFTFRNYGNYVERMLYKIGAAYVLIRTAGFIVAFQSLSRLYYGTSMDSLVLLVSLKHFKVDFDERLSTKKSKITKLFVIAAGLIGQKRSVALAVIIYLAHRQKRVLFAVSLVAVGAIMYLDFVDWRQVGFIGRYLSVTDLDFLKNNQSMRVAEVVTAYSAWTSGIGSFLFGHGFGAEILVTTGRGDYAELLHSLHNTCLLYTSPSPRDRTRSRMPSSA